jgi:phenylacetate-coenzyme A ligase PaaK-like adenylate-forming protein
VTNLSNRVQPLIRFELTDVATLEPEPCPCGRTLLRLRSAGRAAVDIRLGGVAVHPMQFGLITTDPDVRELQVVRHGERLTVRVVLGEEANAAPTRLREAMTGSAPQGRGWRARSCTSSRSTTSSARRTGKLQMQTST